MTEQEKKEQEVRFRKSKVSNILHSIIQTATLAREALQFNLPNNEEIQYIKEKAEQLLEINSKAEAKGVSTSG